MHSSFTIRVLTALLVTALTSSACIPRDADGDGIADDDDNCAGQHNPGQLDFDDDGFGDACDDHDNDSISDANDNCRTIMNHDQADMDLDSIGNVCDEDVDGDTVLNQDDVCPEVKDPGQYDEDLDGVGDPCDNCPATANPGQEDELDGGDRVGDACDPRPAAPGDSIALFDGFAEIRAGVPEGWAVIQGAGHDPGEWRTENGRLVQARIESGNPTSLYPTGLEVTERGMLIETVVTVDSLAADSDAAVGMLAGYSESGNDGYSCSVENLSGVLTRLLIVELRPGGLQSQDTVTEWELGAGQTYRLDQYQLAGTEASTTLCQAVSTESNTGRLLAHVDPQDVRPTRLPGLRAHRAAVSFHHVVVYGLGGAVECNLPGPCL